MLSSKGESQDSERMQQKVKTCQCQAMGGMAMAWNHASARERVDEVSFEWNSKHKP
jgi:hypothetical protein